MKKQINPPAHGIKAIQFANAEQFNADYESWVKTVGNVEIVHEDDNAGPGKDIVLIFWRKSISPRTIVLRSRR
jgi:hypothetical protein